MFITLPDAVLHAIQHLNKAGFEAYAVGGCVRDSLMGKSPEDWDITTSATPEEMQAVFHEHRCLETGLQHGTLTVIVEDTSLEITTYRVDGTYSDGRHPDSVVFTRSLAEDLRRRDFTINAMAYHPIHGLVDLYGGREDLRDGTIRCVGDANCRFNEDALRILRALRFASVLGFTLESDTAAALRRLAPTLTRVAMERITTEWAKLLCGTHCSAILQQFSEVVSVFLPEIRLTHDYALLTRVNPSVHTRLAALFLTTTTPLQEAEASLQRLRLDKQTVRRIHLLLTAPPPTNSMDDAFLLRLLNHLDADLVFDYFSVYEIDTSVLQRTQQLLNNNVCYRISMLAVNGDDLVGAGISPGIAVGATLNDLLNAVMDGVCANTKNDLLAYVNHQKKPVQ